MRAQWHRSSINIYNICILPVVLQEKTPMYVTYEIFMCGRDVLECVISPYDVTYNRNVYTLFFFCETSQKRKFC